MRLFDPHIWTEVTGGAIAERVRRLVRVTPLIPAPALGRRTGADVWLKLESLQRTGSFKLRGAAAFVAGMSQVGKKRVIAASAGNHGLGVALAARTFGVQAQVLVSAQTPQCKRDGILALGAGLEVAGASYDEAEAEARRRAGADPSLSFASAFDDDWVIAGMAACWRARSWPSFPTWTRWSLRWEAAALRRGWGSRWSRAESACGAFRPKPIAP